MRTKEICQELFYCNSSAIQMYGKQKTCLHVFASGHLYVLSAFL